MPRDHISVWNALGVSLIAILLVLGGLVVGFIGLMSMDGGLLILGIFLFFAGLFIGGINKLFFRARTTQLKIDTRESIRDRFSTSTFPQKKYCRYCGFENKGDSVFCEKCGKQIA